MNNIPYSTYISSPNNLETYSIKTCPNYIDNKKHQIITSNDGNKHQRCVTCGWEWRANK